MQGKHLAPQRPLVKSSAELRGSEAEGLWGHKSGFISERGPRSRIGEKAILLEGKAARNESFAAAIAVSRGADERSDLPAAAVNVAIVVAVIAAIGSSAASNAAMALTIADSPAIEVDLGAGTSPDTKLREGKVARNESAAAAIVVAKSAASDMDGSTDARGGPKPGGGTDWRVDLAAVADNVAPPASEGDGVTEE